MTLSELIEEITNCPCGTGGHCMSCAPLSYLASDAHPTLFRPIWAIGNLEEILDFTTWKEQQ